MSFETMRVGLPSVVPNDCVVGPSQADVSNMDGTGKLATESGLELMTEVLVEENLFAHCAYIAPLAPPASATQSDAANVSQCPDCIRVKMPRLDASRTPTAVAGARSIGVE